MNRSFIAIDVPVAVKQTISDMQADLRRRFPQDSIAWTRPEGIHLTLHFLGDIYKHEMNRISEAISLGAENFSPFDINTTVTGTFPSSRPRVLWWGVNGGKELMALHESIGERLVRAGFAIDAKKYHPHLTMGRVKALSQNSLLPEYFGRLFLRESESIVWQAADIKLMSSVLKPSGAVYSVLEQVRL